MQPAPYPVPMQPVDPQFGPVVSEYEVGGKRYWLVFSLVLFLCLVALAGFIAVLAEGSFVGGAVIGSIILAMVLLLVALSGVRLIVYTHGVERRGRFGKKRLGWDQLQSYTLNVIDPSHAAPARVACSGCSSFGS